MTPQKAKLGISGILMVGESFLLGRRNADDTQGGMWVTPGGGVEFGESLDEALAREFKEEVLLEVVVVPGFISVQERIKDERHVVMIFKRVSGPNPTKVFPGDGFSDVGWFNWEQIEELQRKCLITEMTWLALNEFRRQQCGVNRQS